MGDDLKVPLQENTQKNRNIVEHWSTIQPQKWNATCIVMCEALKPIVAWKSKLQMDTYGIIPHFKFIVFKTRL